MWSGVERTLTTLPKGTAGHATAPVTGFRTSVGVTFVAIGLPPLTPKGPKLVKADTACALAPPGKQPASWARPAGVGVIPLLANGLLTLIISWLKPPDKKNLFLIQGPPI